MKIIADTHTHTIACGHVYSTLSENVVQAKARGLKYICHTEPACKTSGGPDLAYTFRR